MTQEQVAEVLAHPTVQYILRHQEQAFATHLKEQLETQQKNMAEAHAAEMAEARENMLKQVRALNDDSAPQSSAQPAAAAEQPAAPVAPAPAPPALTLEDARAIAREEIALYLRAHQTPMRQPTTPQPTGDVYSARQYFPGYRRG